MKSYSQCGEDVWILENLKPTVGTFAEIGAYDGVLSSNTLLFEQMGWGGLLVEADPFLAAQCMSNRKTPTWCCAVGLGTHGIFKINLADRGASGFNGEGKRVPVLIRRLEWLLIASGFASVDFLSIDTEGTELEVWESIGSIRPRVVMLEYQTFDQPSQEVSITEQMVEDGYKLVHKTQYNLIFETAPKP